MTGRGEQPGRPGASGAHGAPGAHGVSGGAGPRPRTDEGGASGGTGPEARTTGASGGAPASTSTTGSAAKPAEPSGVDLARVALRAAKEQARARGAAAQQRKQARRGGGLRSGARSDGRDPQPLGSAINRLITERGWETPAVVGGVMGRWPQIVGEDLANHCVPLRYDEDPAARVLTVSCDSTAWATQLRLLAPQLVARLNADLGQGTVRMIKVVGPGGGERRFGPLRAPGSKGPGDTYG
ncbi:DciA family protein [Streptomyces cavourensis]|nr:MULTISPECIES: DciA family protein [Streptomyces]MDI7785282.1 DciA family protein [Streptomyces cavourensis]